MTKQHYLRVVSEKIDPSSSPGYPLNLSFTTNRQLFKFDEEGNFSEEAAEMVWAMVKDHIEGRYADPIRLFVKPEPHTKAKIQMQRYRLISSVSVVDSIIDHMLFSPFNDQVAATHQDLSCKVGWSQYGGGWMSVPLDGVAMDKSSWDWTAKSWLFEITYEVRKQLCVNMTQQWEDLASFRYKSLFGQPHFVTSGGLVFRQTIPGIMKSGCVNTIIDNSMMQEIIHLRACLALDIPIGWIMTMGDDTYQSEPPDLEAYCDFISKFCLLKQVERKAEFAGVRFFPTRVEPAYWAKHCYQLLHANDKFVQEIASSYRLFYHHSRYVKVIEKVLLELGVVLPTAEFCSLVYDSWE